jgi:lysophospholipase L1-like esterase
VRREWLLLAGTAVLTLAAALGLLRWLAPGLLGIRPQLEVVQVSREVAPFFETVLPVAQLRSTDFHIDDPYTGTRHHPQIPEVNLATKGVDWGPEDLLGFRNRAVPIVADVVTVGDSQTFGSNATMDFNWPSLLARRIGGGKAPVVYNMSSGGWGAPQYLDMFNKSEAFRPRVVVVAYYTGNDALDSVGLVYHAAPWAFLRHGDRPPEQAPNAWPPKESEMWPVRFPDGTRTVFTAKTRLAPNDRRYPATRDGYRIMADVARRIDAAAAERGVGVVFTIIPTKETAFAAKVHEAGLEVPEAYAALIRDEADNIRELAAVLAGLPHAAYVDVVTPLQKAILGPEPMYLPSGDGHPLATGYDVIARTLAPVVARLLPPRPVPGLARIKRPDADAVALALIRNGAVWLFDSPALLKANGWNVDVDRLRVLSARDVADLRFGGVVRVTDARRFGPRAP